MAEQGCTTLLLKATCSIIAPTRCQHLLPAKEIVTDPIQRLAASAATFLSRFVAKHGEGA